MYIIDVQNRDLEKRTELIYNRLSSFRGSCVLFNLNYEFTKELILAFPDIVFIHQHESLDDYANNISFEVHKISKEIKKETFSHTLLKKAMDSLPIEILRCFTWLESYAITTNVKFFDEMLIVSGDDNLRYCYSIKASLATDRTTYKIIDFVFKPYD